MIEYQLSYMGRCTRFYALSPADVIHLDYSYDFSGKAMRRYDGELDFCGESYSGYQESSEEDIYFRLENQIQEADIVIVQEINLCGEFNYNTISTISTTWNVISPVRSRNVQQAISSIPNNNTGTVLLFCVSRVSN